LFELSKLKIPYTRVASEAQLPRYKSTLPKDKEDKVYLTIKNKKSPCILPRQLMELKYYKTRIDVHDVIKA
jgi:hypothetical protein